MAVPQPHETGASWFRLLPVRSPLLGESRLISFPPGTEMFHFPGLSRPRLCIQRGVAGRMPVGLPHSEIPGSTRVCRSPGLIAAYHVLHRLRMPRHPPCALSNLTGYDSSYPFVLLSSILGYVADAGHGSSRTMNTTLGDVKEPAIIPPRNEEEKHGREPRRRARAKNWWSRSGSNRRPPACKAGALPTELLPRKDPRPAPRQEANSWWA